MANNIGGDYYHPMDREYKKRASVQNMGPHIFEDVEGRFTSSLPKWIRSGVESVELQFGHQKIESGPEGYGREARQELKELARLTGVNVHTVHAPVRIQGLAGWNNQRGFQDENRDRIVNQIAQSIDFSAEATEGSNIVFHLGEFPRAMASKFKDFEQYAGEEEEATSYFGDRFTGRVIGGTSRDQKFTALKRDNQGKVKLDENGEPKFEELSWQKLDEEWKNAEKEGEAAKKAFDKRHTIFNRKIWDGDVASLALLSEKEHEGIDKMVRERRKLENDNEDEMEMMENTNSESQRERLSRRVNERKEHIAQINRGIKDLEKKKNNLVTLKTLGMPRTADTLAQAGMIAWDRTVQHKLANPITLTPENLSPGEFGSHPDELIEIVQAGRKAFVDRLCKEKIADPRGLVNENGKPLPIANRYFREEWKGREKEAMKLAEKHIRSTIDAQHLQMWQEHFKREPGETEEQKEKRFYKWYDKELRKLMEANVIGHVHVVDGMGRGHTHLPFGEGRIAERSKAVDELIAMGFSMTHEGWMEGPERHLVGGYHASGKTFDMPSGEYSFTGLYHAHTGSVQAPPYLIPDELDFTSHKEDFQMWSELPLE
jgi:hypothetical protein